MAVQIDHPAFRQLSGPSAKLRRYMSFTKFVSMLDRSSLFFSRADKLGDPFEGSIPDRHAKRILRDHPVAREGFGESLATLHNWLCQWTFVSCWHANERESAAMWRLYSASDGGVAIQTNCEKLVHCHPESDSLFAGGRPCCGKTQPPRNRSRQERRKPSSRSDVAERPLGSLLIVGSS
jgi:hypothetical protein